MIPGSIGETSTMACLLVQLFLIFTGVGSLRIILSFFAGGFIMGLLLNAIGGNPYLDLPAYYHLIIGGFAFGAVYMATDPVTASQTETEKNYLRIFRWIFSYYDKGLESSLSGRFFLRFYL